MSLFTEEIAKPTYTKFKRLVIDADSLIYRACHIGQKEYQSEEGIRQHPLFTESWAGTQEDKQREIFHSMVDGIIFSVQEEMNTMGYGLESALLIFTPKRAYQKEHNLKGNFRYEIYPEYKSSRKGMVLPEGIDEMYDYALRLDNSIASDHCEADDVVAWIARTNDDIVVAALDKDILSGVPGKHFNYNKNEWIDIDEYDAELFVFRQCMTGDSSDSIPGIYRFGPKAAEKALEDWYGEVLMWRDVLSTFVSKGYDRDYAILQMRLVNLHQLNDEGEVELWVPPLDEWAEKFIADSILLLDRGEIDFATWINLIKAHDIRGSDAIDFRDRMG